MLVVYSYRGDDVRLISVRNLEPKEKRAYEKEYDFSNAKRGAVLPQTGKTRITIYLDDAVVSRFKTQSEQTGKGYQTLINRLCARSLLRILECEYST